MAKIHHFESFSIVRGDIDIHIDLSRFTDQFNAAQFELDSMVMTSMERFMPFQNGDFINETKAESASMAGTGQVCAGISPHGRFLYEGNAMIGEKTRSAWAKLGEEKVLSGKKLTYSNGRQSHWFEAAKKADKKRWVSVTKKNAGGG